MAAPSYDATTGEMTSVSYPAGSGNGGNGTSLSILRDSYGRASKFTWAGPSGTMATDEVTRTLAGPVKDDLVDGAVLSSSDDYVYDSAGRLTSAYVKDASGMIRQLTYSFSSTHTCGVAATDKNSNRTTSVSMAGTSYSYCYDSADRITNSTDPSYLVFAYDSHGNATIAGSVSMGFDGTDRHMRSTVGATTVSY